MKSCDCSVLVQFNYSTGLLYPRTEFDPLLSELDPLLSELDPLLSEFNPLLLLIGLPRDLLLRLPLLSVLEELPCDLERLASLVRLLRDFEPLLSAGLACPWADLELLELSGLKRVLDSLRLPRPWADFEVLVSVTQECPRAEFKLSCIQKKRCSIHIHNFFS